MDAVLLLLITLAVVALSVLLLGVRVFFTRRWGFPSSHVEDQPLLKAKGLSCHRAQHFEAERHRGLFELIEEEK